MADELSRTFLGSGPAGYGVSAVMGAVLTAWDPTTYANTVTDGAYTFTDCLVTQPSTLVAGRVLLYITPGGPVILGNTYKRVTAAPNPDVPGGGGSNPSDPGGGTDPGGGGTDPDPGTLAWTRTYPDGTAYPTIDGGGSASSQNLTNLASAVSGSVYAYTGSTITSATSVDFTGKSNITITGITMGLGGSLTPKAGTNIVLEVNAPYENTNGAAIVKWVGQYNRVLLRNSTFGPASAPGTPPATKNRFVQFGDSASVGAKFGTVKLCTFQNKAGPGNPIHAAGDTANATGGVRYTLITRT
jgi:hypothetical protein